MAITNFLELRKNLDCKTFLRPNMHTELVGRLLKQAENFERLNGMATLERESAKALLELTERIRQLEAYNQTRTDELLAATIQIVELQRELGSLKIPTKGKTEVKAEYLMFANLGEEYSKGHLHVMNSVSRGVDLDTIAKELPSVILNQYQLGVAHALQRYGMTWDDEQGKLTKGEVDAPGG